MEDNTRSYILVTLKEMNEKFIENGFHKERQTLVVCVVVPREDVEHACSLRDALIWNWHNMSVAGMPQSDVNGQSPFS